MKHVASLLPPEEALSPRLAQVAAGEWSAFKELFDETSAALFGVATALLGPGLGAEAVTRQAYLQVWRRAGRHEELGISAGTWLVSLVRDAAAARVRGEGTTPEGATARTKAPSPDWSVGVPPDKVQLLYDAYLGRSWALQPADASALIHDILAHLPDEDQSAEAIMAALLALGLLDFEATRQARARLQVDAVFIAEHALWSGRLFHFAPAETATPPESMWSRIEEKFADDVADDPKWTRPLGIAVLVAVVIYAIFADPGWL